MILPILPPHQAQTSSWFLLRRSCTLVWQHSTMCGGDFSKLVQPCNDTDHVTLCSTSQCMLLPIVHSTPSPGPNQLLVLLRWSCTLVWQHSTMCGGDFSKLVHPCHDISRLRQRDHITLWYLTIHDIAHSTPSPSKEYGHITSS